MRLDFRALPFRTACADGVFCAYTSWGYFATEAENLRQLEEFTRVLRPGGVLLLDLAGRGYLQEVTADVDDVWLDFPEEGYQERVTWSSDDRRIITERICQGARFCHDIWIPTEAEVRGAFETCGLELEQVYGGLDGQPWTQSAERRIYRAIKR